MATQPAQTPVHPEFEKAIAAGAHGIRDFVAEIEVKSRGAADVDAMTHSHELSRACLTAALPLLPSLQEWRGIESAPKDGTEFLGLNMRATVVGYRVVYFDDEAKEPYIWHVEDAGKGFNHHRDFFTHWMPLPTPPSIEKSGSEK